MPVTTKVFDDIIGELIEGRSLRRILQDHRIAPRAFHAALLRNPAHARDYMMAKSVQLALDFGPRLEPMKDWVSLAEAACRARRSRYQQRDIQMLERIEAKIETSRVKARSHPAAPQRLSTLDDLKAKGDVITVYDLRRRGALRPDAWTVMHTPARHPGVERLVAAKFRLQIHVRGRDNPQSLAIEWIPTAVYDRPVFRCDCGRRALKLYPKTASTYACRYCVLGGSPRYRASSKYRPPCRVRVRAPIAHGLHGPINRDPATGRFLPLK